MYLTDMGLARMKTSCCTMTQVGGAIGTPYYCAPESYMGGVCLASDIWSFGLVLREIFGRKHAWGRLMTQAEMAGLIMCKTLPPLGHLKAHIKDVCEMCLKYNPKHRIEILELLKKIRACEKL